MARNRETLFPSTSLGRPSTPQLQRVPSRESLNAHPLLTSSPPASAQHHPGTSPENTPPRYVPYTPRQRPPTSAATTGTTTQLSVPVTPHPQTGATSRLQVQNLKAAAQSIGLGSGTVGWSILEKLVDGDTAHEWDEIWTVLTTVKPTLLLPLEPYSGEAITPDFVKDHIAISISASSSVVVTLSGLRGTIESGLLTFQSTVPTTSPSFTRLFKHDTQPPTLGLLAPSFSAAALHALPSFAIPGSSSLPLPPRFHNAKPPLPPRPGATLPKSRIGNTFASLFGRPATPVQNPPSSSPSSSVISLPGDESHTPAHIVEIPAHAIGNKISKKLIGKELSTVIQSEIKSSLSSCPRWVVNRVIEFTNPLHPIPKAAKQLVTRSSHRSILPAVTLTSDTASLEDAFQALYDSIDEDMHAGSPILGRHREKSDKRSAESDIEDDPPIEKDGKEKDKELHVKEIIENVEGTICRIFYDRLFSPVMADDTSHDEALANRIAGLNMLDLGLQHLGVEIPAGRIEKDVNDVVAACGAVLQKLEDEDNRSPGRKAELLVEAHREIVDGLSKLPKLRLKPEEDIDQSDLKTPKPGSFAKQQDATKPSDISLEAPEITIETVHDSTTTESENAIIRGETTEEINSSPVLEAETSARELSDSVTTVRPDDVPPDIEATVASRTNEESSQDQSEEASTIPVEEQQSEPFQPTPVSGDILFPFLIFSVVKANPAHLVSHLLYTQRFRTRIAGGHESYCLVNLMAVVEFLENVDMGALGLGDSERVMSTADLSPIPLNHGTIDAPIITSSPFSIPQLGKRVTQQVEELAGLAGSANKAITGVVDSSFGMLKGILGTMPVDTSTPHGELQDAAPWNSIRPGIGLLRRGSGFSIAGMSVTGRPKTPAPAEAEEGQQLVEVSSRPGSIKAPSIYDETSASETDGEEGEDDEPNRGDTRSIRSFSSMMSKESRDKERDREGRVSLADRLASMTKLGNSSAANAAVAAAAVTEQAVKTASPSPSRPPSWQPPPRAEASPDATLTSQAPPKIRIPPLNKRFMECAEQDIRVGEVGELLREYRRMALALKNAGMLEE
ncbi:hypothetical protein M422DRAFT_63368 [Sphaerobolus stellatus SS14]|nr:hypothetical protein M422DRAFT_63368 [Sphaerobolus stellatus SS14]